MIDQPVPSEEERSILDEAGQPLVADHLTDDDMPCMKPSHRDLPRLLTEARASLARSESQALGYMRERDEANERAEKAEWERDAIRSRYADEDDAVGQRDRLYGERVAIRAERDAALARVAKLEAALHGIRDELRRIAPRVPTPVIDALLAESTTPTTESEHGH